METEPKVLDQKWWDSQAILIKNLVVGSACRYVQAEHAGMCYGYVICRSYHTWSIASDSEGRQYIGMQNKIRRKERLVVNNSNIRLDYNDWAYYDD